MVESFENVVKVVPHMVESFEYVAKVVQHMVEFFEKAEEMIQHNLDSLETAGETAASVAQVAVLGMVEEVITALIETVEVEDKFYRIRKRIFAFFSQSFWTSSLSLFSFSSFATY